MKACLGANSIDWAASVGAIATPVTPPLDSGATPSACHSRCSFAGKSSARGNDAQATVLHSRASAPALFHPGRGQVRASERRNGCAWVRDVNTAAVMAN
jgi:hypothetical protein